jgi:hypothetical protein
MSKPHLIISGAASLFVFFTVGCSQPHHSVVAPSAVADSGTTQAQLDQIRKDFGVVVEVRDHKIIVGTAGLATKEQMSQIEVALHRAFGNDFTNYTMVHIVK